MSHIPALWYFDTSDTYSQWFRTVKFVVIPPLLVKQQYLWSIAIQSAFGCYNTWTNLQCSGCSPLGEKLLWNRSIGWHNSRASCKIDIFLNDWSWIHDWSIYSLVSNVLTHLPLDKMATISQTIFSDAFSWMKMFVFWCKISLKFVRKCPIDNNPALV